MVKSTGIWVLLLNWRNAKDTIECLQSIVEAEDKAVRGVVVCDNGSNDGSVEDIKNWLDSAVKSYWDVQYTNENFSSANTDFVSDEAPNFVFIDNGYNYGFAGGNNVGLDFIQQYLPYEYVFVLNNDTIIESSTVSECIEHFETNPKMGLCGCKVVYEHSRHLVQAYGGASFNPMLGRAVNVGSMNSTEQMPDVKEVEAKLDYILGAAMMISKPCLQSIGLMEDKYFLYFEEIDWAVRATRAGFTLGFAGESIVYHKEGASIGSSHDKAKRSLLADYYLVSSRIKFTHKFFPYYLPSVYLFCLFQALRNLAQLEFNRFKTIVKAMCQIPLT